MSKTDIETLKTDIEILKNANWDKLEEEVVTRIRLLKVACQHLESNELNDRIAEDLFLPALATLGKFCVNIQIEGER